MLFETSTKAPKQSTAEQSEDMLIQADYQHLPQHVRHCFPKSKAILKNAYLRYFKMSAC